MDDFVEGKSNVEGHFNKHRSSQSRHWATWCASAVVAWGSWNAQTDCYPFNESQARPSWYVYGWPLCFATSGRGRLNFGPIDWTALAFDLTVTVVVVACTIFAVEILSRCWPRFALIDSLAIVAGLSVMLFVWTDAFHQPARLILGTAPPPPEVSAIEGDARVSSRLPVMVTFPLSLGLFAAGFTIVRVPLTLIRWRQRSLSTENQELTKNAPPQFTLLCLLWFATACALCAYLFSLPPVRMVAWVGHDPQSGEMIAGHYFMWTWPDVAMRIAIPAIVFLTLPTFFRWSAKAFSRPKASP